MEEDKVEVKNTLSEKIPQPPYIFNGVICQSCLGLAVTRSSFDNNSCPCGKVTISGGRNTNIVAHTGKVEPVVFNMDSDYEVAREYIERGEFLPDGSVAWRKLRNLTDSKLTKILFTGGADWYLVLVTKELQYRHKKKMKQEKDKFA